MYAGVNRVNIVEDLIRTAVSHQLHGSLARKPARGSERYQA